VKDAQGRDIDDSSGWVTRAQAIIESLVSRGAVVVTGSGNAPVELPIVDGWPANFGNATKSEYISSVIVAGGISGDGKIVYGRGNFTAGVPHLYAPGKNIKCAQGNENQWSVNDGMDNLGQYKIRDGTSHGTSRYA
jgi:hypothetical protein